MKTGNKGLFLAALIALLLWSALGEAAAEALTTLHSFQGNGDGDSPYAGVIVAGNTLYGTASGLTGSLISSNYQGTVFKINVDGNGYTNLHDFRGDGWGQPLAGLVLSANILYGTTAEGGFWERGAIFKLNTDGTGFTNLYDFAQTDGAHPRGRLVLAGNTLYGTTADGGDSNLGTVFAINTDGTGFTRLYSFSFSDGANPWAGLALSSNRLFGTTLQGGSFNNGTVFGIGTDGTGFTNLHTFTGNEDGSGPVADLIMSGETLYGTTWGWGASRLSQGTVFAINTDGSGFTNLHAFTGGGDGGQLVAGLILSGRTLYGTSLGGGSSNLGTVFGINTDGQSFTNLYSFTGGSHGAGPKAQLVLGPNSLLGTTVSGGSWGQGTVFSLSLQPRIQPELTIARSGLDVILTWTGSSDGFALQSTTNLGSPAVWTQVSTAPVLANGRNSVTNSVSGNVTYYRLIQGVLP